MSVLSILYLKPFKDGDQEGLVSCPKEQATQVHVRVNNGWPSWCLDLPEKQYELDKIISLTNKAIQHGRAIQREETRELFRRILGL